MSSRRRSIAAGLLLTLGCAEPGVGPDQGPTTGDASTSQSEGPSGASTSLAASTSTASPETSSADTTSATADGPATSATNSGGPVPALCPPGVEPAIELGYGDEQYRPLDSGVAQLVQGHQGGFHVVLGMRGVGLDLADWVDGHLRATLADQLVADFDTIIVMSCDEGGDFSEALWINLIFEADPQALLGQVVSVEAELIDASDQHVSTTAEITISDDVVPL